MILTLSVFTALHIDLKNAQDPFTEDQCHSNRQDEGQEDRYDLSAGINSFNSRQMKSIQN